MFRASFVVPDDEWYTYDKSPRPNVHVLANVDEFELHACIGHQDGRSSGGLGQ